MIYDPVLGLIFIKTTKVAGSSFEASIAPFLSPKTVVTINEKWSTDQNAAMTIRLRKTHWLPLPRLLTQIARHRKNAKSIPVDMIRRRGPRHECFSLETDHMSAQQIRSQIGQAEWDRCLKVAIVRSPYDQLISDYFMKKNKNANPFSFPSINDWVRQNPERILRNQRILELDTKDSQGVQRKEIQLDLIIHYENFEEDLRTLAKRLELSGDALWEKFEKTRVHSSYRPDNLRTDYEHLLDMRTKSTIRFLLNTTFDFFSFKKPDVHQSKVENVTS